GVCVGSRVRSQGSEAFVDGGDAHAAADAQGGQVVAIVLALQFVDEGAEDHRAGGAERVTQCDGAAVDVDLVQGQAHVLDEAQHDRGERLVDLDEVDVVDGQPGDRKSVV